MERLITTALSNPWRTLEEILDRPLHPGGSEATIQLLDRAGVQTGTRVLDVGCGSGDGLAVARQRGARPVGVDPDPPANTARVVRGTATTLPVRAGAVDVLLAECVLCLTDLDIALEEANRVLACDGRFALSDVIVADDGPAVPAGMAEALCLDGARSREQLVAAVKAGGFTIERVTNHHEAVLDMRDRVVDRVDYDGLIGMLGDRGQDYATAFEELNGAIDAGEVSYLSLVATP